MTLPLFMSFKLLNLNLTIPAKVAELAYALDLGSSSERIGGSTPPFRSSAGVACLV